MSAADAGGNAAAQEQPRLVQHVILRKDLTKTPYKWPAGSMIAQGCHVVRGASTFKCRRNMRSCLFVSCCVFVTSLCHIAQVSKTLWELKEEPNVQAYMADIDNMHKVTLAAKDEEELKAVITTLSENGLQFRSWLEQPEGILTAVATMPYPRDVTSPHLKHLSLYR